MLRILAHSAAGALTPALASTFFARLAPLWVLALISPIYETLMSPKEFPFWLEVLLLISVFVLSLSITGFKRWGRACWLATLSVYGAVSLFKFVFHISTQGRISLLPFFMLFLCALCLWTLSQHDWLNRNAPSTADNERWSKKFLISLFSGWLIWIVTSLLDGLLIRREFLSSASVSNAGSYIALATLVTGWIGFSFVYWLDKENSYWQRILMPLFIGILMMGATLAAHSYGLAYAAFTVAFGSKQTLIVQVKDKRYNASKFCPYRLSFSASNPPVSTSSCVSYERYKAIEVGNTAEIKVLQSRVGALVQSRIDWKP